ncbi:hypothetical protein [Gordonia sp. UCD-TK1]|nr:hypothetical protein [Gordonia sp. UCD-TK1]
MDWFRPRPAIEERAPPQDTKRAEARQWWADQPARIAARLEEHQ